MSVKKIDEIKSHKWLSIWDAVAFGAIIIIAVALILAFTLGGDKSSLGGFYVAYRGERVFECDFSDGSFQVLDQNRIAVEEAEGGYTLRFSADGGYNLIFADLENRTVRVTESDCSPHKDCVYTPKLSSNSSSPIICTPHSLTIAPLEFVDDGNLEN